MFYLSVIYAIKQKKEDSQKNKLFDTNGQG